MGNRLYVGNLSFHSTEENLRNAFAAHGSVVEVHLAVDRMTGQARGFGFVTMGSPGEAESAMQALNGAALDGRSLKVNEAEDRAKSRGGSAQRGDSGGSSKRGW